MFCTNCGASLQDNARFCSKCGKPQRPVTDAAPQPASAPQPAPQPVPQPAPQAESGRCALYMDAKGLSLFNYKFDIRDAAGNLRYRAASVTESWITYNARIYNPDDSEAMIVHQQKKLTFSAMNFDILDANGQLVTEVIQKVHFTKSEFQLTNLGIVVTGDFFSTNFTFKQGDNVVCSVRKKVLSWGDCYELEFADPRLEKILLATVMVIQLVIAASRRRRR